jgi:hypothetical protein
VICEKISLQINIISLELNFTSAGWRKTIPGQVGMREENQNQKVNFLIDVIISVRAAAASAAAVVALPSPLTSDLAVGPNGSRQGRLRNSLSRGG